MVLVEVGAAVELGADVVVVLELPNGSVYC